jgi:hypothetical protein
MASPPLYHGTRAPLGPGGYVVPGDDPMSGDHPSDHHGLGRSDVVYVTPDYELAAAYALAAKGSGRPRVLEVMPLSPVEVDDSTIAGGEEQESYMCEWARVEKVVAYLDLQGAS